MRCEVLLKALIASAILIGVQLLPVPSFAKAQCTNAKLKSVLQLAPTDPARAPSLQKLVICLGNKAEPITAAESAYELALHFAGANKDRPSDFSQAAIWAKKSVTPPIDECHQTIDPHRVAALQINYYAATDASELSNVARARPPFPIHAADAAIGRLQAEVERLQNRIHAMYIDKLDGRIDRSFYVQMSEQWRIEQEKLMQEITLHQAADQCYLDEGMRLLELAQSAQRLFAKQEPNEQRRMLNFVLSNSTWQSEELSVTFRQPFDLIAQTATSGQGAEAGGSGNPPSCRSWWAFLDTYRTLCLAPSPEIRKIFEELRSKAHFGSPLTCHK